MNYASPYTPNYAAPAAAYAQSPYDADVYAQAQQQAAALDQLQQMYGGGTPMNWNAQAQMMPWTGQTGPGGAVIAATPPNLTPLQGAWWQQSTYGVPRWALGAGALALTGIGLAWQAGVFGKMGARSSSGSSRTTSRTSLRRSTARDAMSSRSGSRGGSRSASHESGERDMSSSHSRSRSGGRGRSASRRRSR